MGLSAGSVSVSSDGTVTKSGLAGSIFDGLAAQQIVALAEFGQTPPAGAAGAGAKKAMALTANGMAGPMLTGMLGSYCVLDVLESSIPAAAGAATVKAGFTSLVIPQSFTSFLISSFGTPRQISCSVSGAVPSQRPVSMTVSGTTLAGVQNETIALPAGGVVNTANCFSTITQIDFPAGGGVQANLSIGTTTTLGFPSKAKQRFGTLVPVVREFVDLAVPGVAGTAANQFFAPPYGGYQPDASNPPNGARNFLCYYEVAP